jgi:hypothetical protein
MLQASWCSCFIEGSGLNQNKNETVSIKHNAMIAPLGSKPFGFHAPKSVWGRGQCDPEI